MLAARSQTPDSSDDSLPSPTALMAAAGGAEPPNRVMDLLLDDGRLTPRAAAGLAKKDAGRASPTAALRRSASAGKSALRRSLSQSGRAAAAADVPPRADNKSADDKPSARKFPLLRHGRLHFSGDEREVVNEQAVDVSDAHVAPWAVVRTRRDQYQSMPRPKFRAARLEALRRSLHMMQHQWKLEVPSLIISVTGDASESRELRPDSNRKFTHALINASLRTKAWIVTGGSNRGIMKAMGDALGHYHATTPCVGIATLGTIHGRKAFQDPSVGTAYQPAPAEESLASTGSSGASTGLSALFTAEAWHSTTVECITEPIHERLSTLAQELCDEGGRASLRDLTAAELGAAAQGEECLRGLSDAQLCVWLEEQAERPAERNWVDTNHSHYLFVDEGSANYQGEVAFRAELEDMISYCGFDVTRTNTFGSVGLASMIDDLS